MYMENYDDFTVRHSNRINARERQRDDIARVALGKTRRLNRRQVNRMHKELNNKGVAILKEQSIGVLDVPATGGVLQDLALDRLQEIAELFVDPVDPQD
jgi:hypothetical protein